MTEKIYTAHDMYNYFRKSIASRNIVEGIVEYDEAEDEDEESGEIYGWFTYTYVTSNATGNDIVLHCDEFEIGIMYGMLTISHDLPGSKSEATDLLEDYIDTVQMALNGQLATVLTMNSKTEQPQAVELIVTDDKGIQRNTLTVPNYTHVRGDLNAYTYCNNEKHPIIVLSKNHFLRPIVTNGREVVGRAIDLRHPLPLSRKEYTVLDQSVTAQLIGGDPDEPLWQLFYRRIEFWIVCAVVGTPAVWVIVAAPENEWWSTPLCIVSGIGGTFATVFLTSFLLARRQILVDAGKVPLGERLEEWIHFRTISVCIAFLFIANLFIVPIWTTKEQPNVLKTALDCPPIIATLVLASIGVIFSMVITLPTSRRNKIIRATSMVISYGLVLYCNNLILYGGEDAASPGVVPTLLVTLLPIAIIVWYIVDCFRPIKNSSIKGQE